MLEFNSKEDKVSWEEGWEDIRNINLQILLGMNYFII